jgi:hypothetical protein
MRAAFFGMSRDVNSTVRSYALAVPALALLLAASPAAAKPVPSGRASPGPGAQSLSVWGVLDPGPIDGFGFGGRYTMPLVPEGVLHAPRVKDEFTLELGADFVHYSATVGWAPYTVDYTWNGILVVGGVTWNFWLNPNLALYPKLDLGYLFGQYSGWDSGYYGTYGRANLGGVFLQGAAGLIYRFQSLALRVELGSGLLRLGVGFPF